MTPAQDMALALAIRAVGLPLLATLLVLGALRVQARWLRRPGSPAGQPEDPGPVLAAAIWAGVVGVRGLPRWPVADTLDLLGPLALLASLAARTIGAVPESRKRAAEWALGILAAVAIGWLLMVPPGVPGAVMSVGPGALAIGVTWALGALGRTGGHPGTWHAVFAVSAAGSATMLAVSASALLGQVAASLALSGGILALIAFLRPGIAPGPSATAALAAAQGGLLAYGWAFTEAPRIPLLLALAIPASAAVGRRGHGWWTSRGLPVGIALALSGAVVAWSLLAAPDPSPYPY
ncbi:hypothetical protein KBD49_11025 [Myxococcota bacterium]|nr:hypothetical protein [Myxococcota bacterium]